MNGFIFSGTAARRPTQLSAIVAGGGVTKSRNRLAEMVADRIVANDVARPKTKTAPLASALVVDTIHSMEDDMRRIVERFRTGGVR